MAQKKKRLITAEDLYNFQLITACAVSPDGKNVIYAVKALKKRRRRSTPICGLCLPPEKNRASSPLEKILITAQSGLRMAKILPSSPIAWTKNKNNSFCCPWKAEKRFP